jgi:hypothetical protein
MDIYSCQEAFGASDKTTSAMRDAIGQWFSLYYRSGVENGEDPCQRIAYTVVSKLVRTAFAGVSGQGHECREHTCEHAWRFMSRFTR